MVENLTRSQWIERRIEEFLTFSDEGDCFTINLYGKEIRRVAEKYEGLFEFVMFIPLENPSDQRKRCIISRVK